ncbi:MAG: FKBP-type peptidyl-prolyl cis-trans isomerase [Cyclobacteriaceae bacterium]
MKQLVLIFLIVVIGVLFSCEGEKKTPAPVSESALIEAHLDSLIFDHTTSESGLVSYPISLNPAGKTQLEGNVLTFFYQLSVLGGDIIDVRDSLDSDTIVVKQGANAIYPIGIDEALSYLKEGEKWGFVLPSDLGFGTFSFSTLIPANSVLLAEIELLEIKTEDDVLEEELLALNAYVESESLRDTTDQSELPEILPNGMILKRIREGNGRTPNLGHFVESSYSVSSLSNVVLQSASKVEPFEFAYGQTDLAPGFDEAINRMEFGELLLALVPSYLAYKESAQVIPPFLTDEMVKLEIVPAYASSVAPYEPLVFEIELIPADSLN